MHGAGAGGEPSKPYMMGDLTFDYAEPQASLCDRPVKVTYIEYRLLYELSVRAGCVVTHAQLLQQVWGPDHSGRSASVPTVVKNMLRKRGEAAGNPTYISNEPGVGYRMLEESGRQRKCRRRRSSAFAFAGQTCEAESAIV